MFLNCTLSHESDIHLDVLQHTLKFVIIITKVSTSVINVVSIGQLFAIPLVTNEGVHFDCRLYTLPGTDHDLDGYEHPQRTV
jgi:hypothetical protein